jgi:ketosteroid isomerase-like protein
MPNTDHELLTRAYAVFNTRDIDAALAMMHPDVEWPNGMEGGYVSGRSAVGEYWTRQWSLIDPYVEPLRFRDDERGRVVAEVHQVVRNLVGAVIADRIVQHAYVVEGGLIRSMEILL